MVYYFNTYLAFTFKNVSLIFNKPLVSLYIKDTTLESFIYADKAFLILILNYFAIFYKNSFDSYFKGHQKMKSLAFISTIVLATRILISFVFTPSFGPLFLTWACIISNVLGIIIYIIVFRKFMII